MYNNIQGRVINKELQVLDHFETTYNFEVEDNHNYYVSEVCILVHNECDGIDQNQINVEMLKITNLLNPMMKQWILQKKSVG